MSYSKKNLVKTSLLSLLAFFALIPISFTSNTQDSLISVNWIQAAPVCSANQLGGTVFRDFNSNGAFDASEVYVEGITISAYDAANTQLDTTTTDADGEYVLTVGSGVDVRVEMTGLPAYLQPAQSGTIADSSIRFLTNSATCDVDFAVINPGGDFCENNPDVSLACYANADGSTNTTPGFVTFPYNNSGLETDTPYSVTSEISEIGTVWGTAWEPTSEKLYASTFLKRHSTMKDGPGHVYVYDYEGTNETLMGSFDLQGVTPDNGGPAIDLGTVCRDSSCGVTEPPLLATEPWHDQDAFTKVGKMSFGDIDIEEDEDRLWLVNLFQQSLISIDISDPDPFTLGETNQYAISSLPGAPVCSNGEMRPWALTFRDGKGYLGAVCDASTSQDSNDLSGHILSFDPANPGLGFTEEVLITGAQFITGQWQYWTDDWATLWPDPLQGNVLTNLPIIMDIEFEADNDLVVSIGDIVGHMGGYENYGPDTSNTTNVYSHFGHGDVTSFCDDGAGGYVLEPTTGCPGNYSSSGLNGYTEYYQDESADNFPHNSMGGFAMHYSQEELVSVVVDPFPVGGTVGDTQYWNTGGIHWYDVNSGAKTDYYRLYPSLATELFGKASGLGDVELLCSAAPIEIGNRVWLDLNRDGVQDAGEDPIAGVTVELYQGGSIVGTAVTDASGHYYFGGLNDTNMTTGSVNPSETYEVIIDTTQIVLLPYDLTIDNANSDSVDLIDSDGTMNGTDAEASITTQNAGYNRHSLDFGFTPPPTYDLALTKQTDATLVSIGETVTFNIEVTNQGDAPADNITITDYIPTGYTLSDTDWTAGTSGSTGQSASITLSVAAGSLPSGGLVANGGTVTVPIDLTIAVGATNETLVNYAEISDFTDTSGGMQTDEDSTPDVDDTNDAGGTLGEPGQDNDISGDGTVDEDDHDPAAVYLIAYDLALSKVTDATIVEFGDDVTFSIEITNQGNIDADNITITDYIPAGYELNTPDWTAGTSGSTGQSASITLSVAAGSLPSGGLAQGSSITVPITLTVLDTATNATLINYAEISASTDAEGNIQEDIDSTPDTDNTNDIGGSPDTDGQDNEINDNGAIDEDDHDPAYVQVIIETFDLALIKTATLSEVVSVGDSINFVITVYNEGTIAADNITVIDYIPMGLVLNDALWTPTIEGSATRTVSVANGYLSDGGLLPGESIAIPITLQVSPDASGTIENVGEVASATNPEGEIIPDIDSTPDTQLEGNDEDDQDNAPINVVQVIQCAQGSEIGNKIFEDVNCNGKYDKDIDQPLEDIEVKLRDENGDTIDRDDSSSNGKYELKAPGPGRYQVVVDKDDIKKFAYSVDPGSDSNPNNKAYVEIDECGDDTTKMDFGFIVTECELAKTGYDQSVQMCTL